MCDKELRRFIIINYYGPELPKYHALNELRAQELLNLLIYLGIPNPLWFVFPSPSTSTLLITLLSGSVPPTSSHPSPLSRPPFSPLSPPSTPPPPSPNPPPYSPPPTAPGRTSSPHGPTFHPSHQIPEELDSDLLLGLRSC